MTLIKSDARKQFKNIVNVTDKTQLSGDLSSSIEYFIDGVIDMGAEQITVPVGGLTLRGYSFDLSKLITSEPNHSLFISPMGGSGNLIGADYAVEVTGANSKVYDLVSATGDEAFEFERINYNNCTSLGSIENYRQGLESGTGRFGGTPTLELVGTWLGGYRITTSIVRGLNPAMSGPLFKAGTAFVMQSRFLTDINADLGNTASLFDFAPANFPNPSTIQVNGAIISRNGVFNAEDATLTPNISAADLACAWKNNNGLDNTFVGGRLTITTEIATTISAINTEYDIAGTYTSSILEHYDSPANGQLRSLGVNPRDFSVIVDAVIDGTQNNELELVVKKWDNSASSFVTIGSQKRVVNALIGGRDVAIFTYIVPAQLDINDYVKLMIKDNTSTGSVTAEIDSFFTVSER